MRKGRTHYEVLGLGRGATPDEVKQQYRKLAKRYHPDVAKAADAAVAHAAFVRITEAYETLADPFRRHSYDLELQREDAGQPGHANPYAGRAGGPAPPYAPGAAGARRGQSPRAGGSRGAGRAGAGPARGAAAPNGARAAGPSGSADARGPSGANGAGANARPAVAQLLFRAQLDFTRGRFQEALAACREAARLDRRCAAAYSLMGDIHRTRGRAEDAIQMYTIAVQLNPGSRADMEKLDRLARHNPLAGDERRRPLPPSLRVAAAAGVLAAAAFFVLPAVYSGGLVFPDVGLLNRWTDNLLIGMVGSSLILGALGAILGVVGRLDDEMLLATVRTGGGRVPVGVLMLLLSILFFPLALIFYVVVAVMEEGGSRGMLRTLLLATGCMLIFALAVPSAAGQTLLFGGNVLFLCAVLGNLAGGFFRDPWS